MKRCLLTVLLLAVLLPATVHAGDTTYVQALDTVYTLDGEPVLVLLLDPPKAKASVETFGGMSVGYARGGDFSTSVWAGLGVARIGKHSGWWVAFQHASNEALDVSGDGGMLLLSTAHPAAPDLHLLVGPGVLTGFALEGDGVSTTEAVTFELGLLYEWSDIAGIGVIGRAFDEGPRFGYSLDFGVTIFKPDKLLLSIVGK